MLAEPIAAGGVGQVWRATGLLRPEYADHPDTLERFRAEAKHAGSLSHPCVARVYDYGNAGPAMPPYLVMEYVNGPSLADMLAADPVHPVLALDVAAQASAGLDAAHRIGLVHKDIKPGNILVGADGPVKITDFGIAHAAGSAPITGPGLVMGTTQYMAPERIAGHQATSSPGTRPGSSPASSASPSQSGPASHSPGPAPTTTSPAPWPALPLPLISLGRQEPGARGNHGPVLNDDS